ncbi:unnamed protein product [Rhizoctonia solani]|uniref:Protein kinase domain-containing protein n=1 Tax=Rhizoctonia solani TaxID=456999 RepID=A0A8H3HXU9_9AGAM|nr:unnamed protein product [Rhizoctonia solani]
MLPFVGSFTRPASGNNVPRGIHCAPGRPRTKPALPVERGLLPAPPGNMSFLKPSNWKGLKRRKSIISSKLDKSKVFELLVSNGCRDITSDIDASRCTEYPVSNGGFGNIYKGELRDGTETAVKCLRIFEATVHERINENLKLAAREMYAWSRCEHRNIVPFLGFTFFRGQIAMISPWMEGGPLPQYLQRNKKVDRFGLKPILSVYTDCRGPGVFARHPNDFQVHGDLKGGNVLMSSDDVAKLIDFGNTESNDRFLEFTPARITPTPRWAAPELLQEMGRYSFAADIYALGMVTLKPLHSFARFLINFLVLQTFLEAITGKLPFPELRSDSAVMSKVLVKKEAPSRPLSAIPDRAYANALWDLLNDCWQYDPVKRPKVALIISKIKNIQTLYEMEISKARAILL